MLTKYRHIIALPGETFGNTEIVQHHIQLKENTQPIYIHSYSMPHSQ